MTNSPTVVYSFIVRNNAVFITENIVATQQICAGNVKDEIGFWQVGYVGAQICIIGRLSAIEYSGIRIIVWPSGSIRIGKSCLSLDSRHKMLVHK